MLHPFWFHALPVPLPAPVRAAPAYLLRCYTTKVGTITFTVANFSGTVDWGDGQTTTRTGQGTPVTHDYVSTGTKQITLTGTFSGGSVLLNSCELTGELDLGRMQFTDGANLTLNGNPGLTSIAWDGVNVKLDQLNLSGNSVNQFLPVGTNVFARRLILATSGSPVGQSTTVIDKTIQAMVASRLSNRWITTQKELFLKGTGTGNYQSPKGFILGKQDGAPVSPGEGMFLLEYHYNWKRTHAGGFTQATQGYKSVLHKEDVTAPTVYWLRCYKSSAFPEVSTSKPYFFIWSTDHDEDTGDGIAGEIWWGEADTPDFTTLTERGRLFSGFQIETPWLVRINGKLHLYAHRNTGQYGTNEGPISQQTILYTTTGGALHEATWVNEGYVLGVANDDNHTGYARVWAKGDGTYICNHLTKTSGPTKQYFSHSPDGITWTRSEEVLASNQLATGMPAGSIWVYEGQNVFTRNGQNYGIGMRWAGTNYPNRYIALALLDENFRVVSHVADLSHDMGIAGLNTFNAWVEGDIAHCYYKGHTTVAMAGGWDYPTQYVQIDLSPYLP